MKQQEENNKKAWQTPEIIDLDVDKETEGSKYANANEYSPTPFGVSSKNKNTKIVGLRINVKVSKPFKANNSAPCTLCNF